MAAYDDLVGPSGGLKVEIVAGAGAGGAGDASAANQTSQITQETAINTRLGEVQASPTANTVLDRLKALATALAGTLTVATHAVTQSGSWVIAAGSALIGKVGIDQTTDGTTNKVHVANLATLIGEVQASPTSNTLLDRLKAIATALSASGFAAGTAGTPSTDVMSIQGIASMTKLLVTPDSVALPANQSTNIAQMNGVTTSMGVGASGTGTQRVALADIGSGHYETVAASQTDQILGPTGAAGDYLSGLLVTPATTSPGAVSIKDGNGSAISLFVGGASSVSNLIPFFIPLGLITVNATTPGWKVTTGTNVSCVGCGRFT